jgi:hypothetical protein
LKERGGVGGQPVELVELAGVQSDVFGHMQNSQPGSLRLAGWLT